jgi:DNA processing protein
VGEAGLVAALASLDGVGPARLSWLLARGTPSETWDRLARGAVPPPVGPWPRVDAALLARWRQEVRASPDLPARMSARLSGLGARVLVGPAIPEHFDGDPEPPPALFVRGQLPPPDAPRVAIVGTRRASPYGLRIATALGRDLAAAGVGVVSGLALGIDAAAHAGAVEGPGVPVAVIGAGHDRPCPSRNRALGRRVAASGAVLGEVPPGVASAPWRYPARNRLIAALAHVVVVVESASAGGSMSTVAEALARDRSVMAVPGPLGRASSDGCHDLLRDGAEICTGAEDVLTLLGLAIARPTGDGPGAGPAGDAPGAGPAGDAPGASPAGGAGPVGDADPVQRAVLDALADGPLSADAVISRTGAGLAAVSTALGSLVAGGWVARRGGWVERLR